MFKKTAICIVILVGASAGTSTFAQPGGPEKETQDSPSDKIRQLEILAEQTDKDIKNLKGGIAALSKDLMVTKARLVKTENDLIKANQGLTDAAGRIAALERRRPVYATEFIEDSITTNAAGFAPLPGRNGPLSVTIMGKKDDVIIILLEATVANNVVIESTLSMGNAQQISKSGTVARVAGSLDLSAVSEHSIYKANQGGALTFQGMWRTTPGSMGRITFRRLTAFVLR